MPETTTFNMRLNDYSAEGSNVNIRVPLIDELSAGGDASSDPPVDLLASDHLTRAIALRDQILLVTLGVEVSWSITFKDQSAISSAASGNSDAQRELKGLVRWHDSSLRSFNTEIPTIDHALFPSGSDFADLTTGPWPAFVTAFEAYATSVNGLAAIVDSVELVGRSL